MDASSSNTTSSNTTSSDTASGDTCYYELASPLGPLRLVAEDGGALTGLYFSAHRHAPTVEQFGTPVSDADLENHPALSAVRDQLREYFAGQRQEFDVPMAPRGTAFQHRVWAALREIPFGRTASYGQIAVAIDAPGSARAVGMANGRNPISIIVPCHRVIGSDGSLSGYGGGVAHKQTLLDLESHATGASLW